MPPNSTQSSLILFAEGQSSRLGSPKQLLIYKDKNLMQHTIDITLMLGLETVVVLGAFKGEIVGDLNVMGSTSFTVRTVILINSQLFCTNHRFFI